MHRYFVLLATAAVALAAPRSVPALLIVSHDEWALANLAFTSAPESTTAFARNIGSLFAPGGSGNFLVHSQNFGLVESTLATTMTDAGHTWTVDTTPLDLATLGSYDGVFLAGPVNGSAPDNQVLIDYVRAGGNIYLAAGTFDPSCPSSSAGFCDAPTEMAAWDVLLRTFGLSLESEYNGIGGLGTNIPIASSHPLFAGVTELYMASGLSVMDLDPTDSSQEVLVSSDGEGLYATAIPEPGGAALVLLGTSILAWRRRHQATRPR
jgi:hypothetical protein